MHQPNTLPLRLASACGVAVLGFAGMLASTTQAQEATVKPQAAPVSGPDGSRAELLDLYEERSVSVVDRGADVAFRYRLLRPEAAGDAARSAARHPLVLFLHGAGERGGDNVKQLKYLPTWLAEPELRRRHPCFVLAPQCRMDERWVDVSWADGASTPQASAPTPDLAAAIAALADVMAREAVDPARVYLTGLSMGGFGTWDLAARMPERFAAIMPVCGGGDDRLAGRIVSLPIWCFHGDADQAVPVRRSRDMIAAVIAAGGRPIYSDLAGVGHDSWTPAYRDRFVLDWLFGQRR
ncbi:MAG: dienelactone hydrolase family protein [Planctomycetia bacterium]